MQLNQIRSRMLNWLSDCHAVHKVNKPRSKWRSLPLSASFFAIGDRVQQHIVFIPSFRELSHSIPLLNRPPCPPLPPRCALSLVSLAHLHDSRSPHEPTSEHSRSRGPFSTRPRSRIRSTRRHQRSRRRDPCSVTRPRRLLSNGRPACGLD
jgi:hypothetical protein